MVKSIGGMVRGRQASIVRLSGGKSQMVYGRASTRHEDEVGGAAVLGSRVEAEGQRTARGRGRRRRAQRGAGSAARRRA
eukprot:1771239-Prymnesium_polylepis.1